MKQNNVCLVPVTATLVETIESTNIPPFLHASIGQNKVGAFACDHDIAM